MKKQTKHKNQTIRQELRNKTLKEKVAYFAELQRKTRDYPDSFIDWGQTDIKREFLANCQETCDFIPTATADELECFVSIILNFLKKYPQSNVLRLCIERKAQVEDFYTLDFDCEMYYIAKNHREYYVNDHTTANLIAELQQRMAKERNFKISESSIQLITQKLLKKLKITLPITDDAVEVLSGYFVSEKLRLEKMQMQHDEQYVQISLAADDFSGNGFSKVIDIADLNARLKLVVP